VPQYLGRLAANAATIINARDYGRTIHDLATRRGLILIGEDVVNAAYDSPVDFPPKEQIEEAETRLLRWPRPANTARGSSTSIRR
jgi:replicative DNA helicase